MVLIIDDFYALIKCCGANNIHLSVTFSKQIEEAHSRCGFWLR